MLNAIKLGDSLVIEGGSPYVISEIGVNHEGSMHLAKEMIEQIAAAGGHAAKFQTYKAETLASKNSPSYWDLKKEPTLSQFQLFKKFDSFGEREYAELSEHCQKFGIEFISTPFDDRSIDFLNDLMPYFKIASADITNIPLLRKIATKEKPVLLSTGASTTQEIDLAIAELENHGCGELALLHCVLNYPTMDSNASLRMISGLKKKYPKKMIGYSDHTIPDQSMTALMTAFHLGANILEKHFTYNKKLSGNDHYHAMDCEDLRKFMEISRKAMELIGEVEEKQPLESEALAIANARRSIVLSLPMKRGETITTSSITYKRPGTGISTLYWDDVIGKTATKDMDEDHILSWSDLE